MQLERKAPGVSEILFFFEIDHWRFKTDRPEIESMRK